MLKHITTIICLALMIIAKNAYARPVSYPGGWTLMQMNDGDRNSLHFHYSPSAKYSVGYKGEYWRKEKWQLHTIQTNYLLKRWNQPAAQANLYLKSGLGFAYSDFESFNSKTEPAGFIGIATDWENRRFFTSYENRAYHAGDIDKFFIQTARIGVAPYIGDYGDVHTWLMLQVDHNAKKEGEEFTITPLIRVFYDVYLFEAGVSNEGDGLFNAIIRF